MKATADLRRQREVLILGLLVAVFVPLLPVWGQFAFTKAEDVFLSALTFVSFLLIDLTWQTGHLVDRERREEFIWSVRETCDTELLAIRGGFVQIVRDAYGENDLFVAHFKKEIHRMAEGIKEVAERHRLKVQADHFLNVDNVLDAFHGEEGAIWRYTWSMQSGDRLFDELAWKRYFEHTIGLVASGVIKEVRTALIVPSNDVLQETRVKRLLDFYKTSKGLDCRIIGAADFRSICSNSDIPTNYIDFGIYGSRLLFLAEQYDPEVQGIFTKDTATIQRYTSLFDSMWGSPAVAAGNPSTSSVPVTLQELYSLDEASE